MGYKFEQVREAEHTVYEPAVKAHHADGHNSLQTLGLCPYCVRPRWLLMCDSTYAHHLENIHGVYKDNTVVPDPLAWAEYRFAHPRRKTGAEVVLNGCVCLECGEVMLTDLLRPRLEQDPLWRRYLGYLRHYKQQHRAPRRVRRSSR